MAPRLAPRNLVSIANVRRIERAIDMVALLASSIAMVPMRPVIFTPSHILGITGYGPAGLTGHLTARMLAQRGWVPPESCPCWLLEWLLPADCQPTSIWQAVSAASGIHSPRPGCCLGGAGRLAERPLREGAYGADNRCSRRSVAAPVPRIRITRGLATVGHAIAG
jgi:hypothetical protein